MVTGEVRKLYERKPLPVMVVNLHNKPVFNEVFQCNPKIVQSLPQKTSYQKYVSGGGYRPYIEQKGARRWVWRPYEPTPGEFYFSEYEREIAEPYRGAVLIEPNVKDNGHRNKAWLYERWQALIDLDIAPMIQAGPPGTRFLGNLRPVETRSFRQAAAILAVCRAFVGTEGGLMHAAAAVGTPAVILWSEFIDPSITGYKSHVNIRHASRTCGARIPCATCRASMERIEVNEVAASLVSVLHKQKVAA
jgi:hypothetical protein